MKLPYILLVDDDAQVLGAIQRDMRSKYRDDYRVVATESAIEALELIKELKLKNEAVALFISDQRMPEMEGVEFLEKALEIYPEAKRVLLTAYSDIDAAIKAINAVKLDYYLLKPWSPPEEKLYPVVHDLLDEWHAHYKPDHEGMRIIGFQWSPKSHKLKEFLSGNLVPFIWIDVENNPEAEKYLMSADASLSNLPLVVLKDGSMRGIVLASSLNFSLKSDDERNAILLQFQDFINSLDFAVQISIQSRRLDIRPYIALLEDRYKEQINDLMKIQTREYIEFIKKFTESTNIMTKSFFVVVPYDPAIINIKSGMASGLFQKKTASEELEKKQAGFEENRTQLEQRVSVVEQGLSRCGIRVIRLGTEEVIELFYKIFNPGDTEKPIKTN